MFAFDQSVRRVRKIWLAKGGGGIYPWEIESLGIIPSLDLTRRDITVLYTPGDTEKFE